MGVSAKIETMISGRFVRLLRRGAWEFASRQKLAGIVAIVAVTAENKIILVEQSRPPLDAMSSFSFSLPAMR